ncbi:MAG TPA: ABC transporter permease, partial [Devosia sp.]
MSETDAIPEFKRKGGAGGEVGISGGMSALAAGPGIRSLSEVLAIVLVAVFIVGGTELLLN